MTGERRGQCAQNWYKCSSSELRRAAWQCTNSRTYKLRAK